MAKQQIDLMKYKQRQIRDKKIVDYYFSHPENNLTKDISKVFNVGEEVVKNAISKELKFRLENSIARRCAKY
jgi:hypothetical protein